MGAPPPSPCRPRPGHSILTGPNWLKAWARQASVRSQGTPPRKTLVEQASGPGPRPDGGSWPDQVQEAGDTLAALRYSLAARSRE